MLLTQTTWHHTLADPYQRVNTIHSADSISGQTRNLEDVTGTNLQLPTFHFIGQDKTWRLLTQIKDITHFV